VTSGERAELDGPISNGRNKACLNASGKGNSDSDANPQWRQAATSCSSAGLL
jgi:hypothetical protein